MTSRFLQIACGVAVLLLVGCEKEEDTISLSTPGTAELYSIVNQTNEIKFRSDEAWTATCKAN